MNEEVKGVLGVLNDDPSGLLYIVSLVNILTLACGLFGRIWPSTPFRILFFVQLLIFPIITAAASYYAIHLLAR